MIAVITGITGQDGAYLAQLLLEKGYTVPRSKYGPTNTPDEPEGCYVYPICKPVGAYKDDNIGYRLTGDEQEEIAEEILNDIQSR